MHAAITRGASSKRPEAARALLAEMAAAEMASGSRQGHEAKGRIHTGAHLGRRELQKDAKDSFSRVLETLDTALSAGHLAIGVGAAGLVVVGGALVQRRELPLAHVTLRVSPPLAEFRHAALYKRAEHSEQRWQLRLCHPRAEQRLSACERRARAHNRRRLTAPPKKSHAARTSGDKPPPLSK